MINLKDLNFDRCYSYFRLRCIVWDLSRSFLLRLAISIFTVILIYTMAQVNTFTCSVDSCDDQAREKCESIGNCHRWVPFPVFIFSYHFTLALKMRGMSPFHVLFVWYFGTLIWDDITKIYLLFFLLPSQKKNELLWNFLHRITQPFLSLKFASK